ncbi:MAG: chemotaxis protein [Clostridiales bacterium]|nr:chemotaxis protein [Clostridiales bacterium]
MSSAHSNQTDILLESGTNEFEIMEFTVAGSLFGINVAKVREIMMACPVTPMQKSHPDIEGIFKPRTDVITVVDLAKHLKLPPSEEGNKDIFVITNFNNLMFAFHVHSVVGIDRISWTKIQKPDTIIYGGEEGVATGIAEYEDRLITILDFEKIIAEISPQTSIQASDLDKLGERPRSDKPIFVVEDSNLLSKLIINSLQKAGYVNTLKFDNGQEAWDFLSDLKTKGHPIENTVSCLVSDIEMPLMDGHHLTKLIKDDLMLKGIPVILFSSLINDEMKKKGLEVGADAQISKPEIVKLVSLIDSMTK